LSSLLLPDQHVDEFDPQPDIEIARAFDRLLRQIDDRLRCFWVKTDATSFEHPGRWHIARLHPNPELCAYWVIQHDDGSYCEPQERHLERLKAMDSHTRNVLEGMRQRRRDRDAARRKAFDETRREFREKLLDRLDHLYNARISVPRVPGAQVTQHGGGLVAVEKSPASW
jgi:hypothetical protein